MPAESQLLQLVPELRNAIWMLVAIVERPLAECGYLPRLGRTQDFRQPALTLMNRQVREEALPIFYPSNIFTVAHSMRHDDYIRWVNRITAHVGHIRHIRFGDGVRTFEWHALGPNIPYETIFWRGADVGYEFGWTDGSGDVRDPREYDVHHFYLTFINTPHVRPGLKQANRWLEDIGLGEPEAVMSAGKLRRIIGHWFRCPEIPKGRPRQPVWMA